MTYRNTIVSSPDTNEQFGYIQDWVSSGAVVQVGNFLLIVYKDCPVRISSMSDPECASAELPANVPSVIASSDPKVIRCINFCLLRERGEALCPMP